MIRKQINKEDSVQKEETGWKGNRVTDNLTQTNRSTESGRKKKNIWEKNQATTQSNSTSVQCCFAPGVVCMEGMCAWDKTEREKKEELSERGKEGKRRQEEKRWAKTVMIETSGGI